MENVDYYAVLGVSPAAADEVIRAAFRALVQNAMDDQPRFAALNEAFETLKDPATRAAYDAIRADAGAERTAMGGGDATIQMNSPIIGGQGAGSNPTVLGYLEGAPCPVCQTVGPPDDGFCQECGLMLGASVGKQPAGAAKLPYLRDSSGRELPLKRGANLVGREGADVMLPDSSVSRRHAALTVSEGNVVTLEELGSTNGTRAAGNPISPGQKVSLVDGATLKFGSVSLTISIPSVPGAARLAIASGPTDKTRLPVPAIASSRAVSAAKLVEPGGKEHVLKAASTALGRKSESDIALSGDAFVSGNHARVLYESGAYKLVDLGSTNGTRVNGQRLAPNVPVALADGDTVQFGQTPLTFRAPK